MSAALRRLHAATGTVALLLGLLALVASSAGVGYAAAKIGTEQLKNNAVTAKKIKKNAVTAKKIKRNAVTGAKIKDGTITSGDLAPRQPEIAATLGNGGEGDCAWFAAGAELPGIGGPTFRLDRDGRVVLSGVAAVNNAPGGDGSCDSSDPGQLSDGIAFVLPPAYVPAKTQYLPIGTELLLIAGPQGFTEGGLTVPPGAVFTPGSAVFLDNVSYEPVGSGVVIAKMTAAGRWSGDGPL